MQPQRDIASPQRPSARAERVDVYGTARGPLARLAGPLAARARARRHARFFALTRLRPGARVLDVGCGQVGLRTLEPQLDITGVDVAERPDYPGPFVRADASAGLPFASGEFDLVYCSSVIEHVHPARRAAFAAEIRRVARGWEEIALLRRGEMEALFGPAQPERFAGLVKSWICVSPPGG